MKKILALLIILVCLNIKAQTWVTIPDANFVHYLDSIIPTAMNWNQMDITSPLVTSVTQTINIKRKSISNLSGIQYFSSLTYLDCSGGANSLNIPALPNSLQYLNCASNYIGNLPVLPNSLIYLNCSQDGLSSMPSLPNSLKHLECSSNSFTSLPSLPNLLVYLDCCCGQNGVGGLLSLPALPNMLDTLICSYNHITCLPVFPNSIHQLTINNNPFTCVPNYIAAMGNDTLAYPKCAAGNTNGCAVATGISHISGLNSHISIYPNPSSGSFQVTVNDEQAAEIKIYDVTGKLVLNQSINGNTLINASSFNEGVYMLNISNKEGTANKKLIIIK